MENTPNKTAKVEALKTTGMKVLALVGFIAVLALLTWGSVQMARVAGENFEGGFANLTAAVTNITSRFFPAETVEAPLVETLALTLATNNAISGEAFTFSWEARENESDTYAFSYACSDGVAFEVPGEANGSKEIVCDTPFKFINTTDTLTLIPRSENNRFIDVPVSINHTLISGEVITGNTLLTIVNEDITDSRSSLEEETGSTEEEVTTPITPITPAPVTPSREIQTFGGTTPAPVISDPNGTPDLSVRIISVGYINPDTKLFVASSSVNRREHEGAVRFEVTNVGTKTSPEWTFEAALPTTPSYEYRPRGNQQALRPGDRIEYTLAFDRVRNADTGSIRIEVDPKDVLDEITRTNNEAKATINIIR